MTREELVRIGANKVRQNATLFATFKKYLFEDAEKVYPNGKVPGGCFNCGYASNFARWAKAVNKPIKIKETKKMSDGTKTYELANRHTRLYFSGKILSAQSSDEEWVKWINNPRDKELVEKRKAYFKKLPSVLVKETKKEVKTEETEEVKETETKETTKPRRGRKKQS